MFSIFKVKPTVMILMLIIFMCIMLVGGKVAKGSVKSYKKSVSTLGGDMDVEISECEN